MTEKLTFKLIGLALIALSISGIYILSTDTLEEIRITQAPHKEQKKTEDLKNSPKILKPWKENLDQLKFQNALPKEWGSIKKIRIILLDENLHAQLKGLKPPIRTSQNGQYILEISFMSHETESMDENKKGKLGIITQYNLIDTQTEEMTWEHSSTFYTNL